MRTLAILAVLACTICAALARDLTLLDGTVFKNITVTKVEGNGIRILHDSGAGFVDFKSMRPEDRKEFGFSEYRYALAAEAEKTQQEEALAQAAALAAAQTAAKEEKEERHRLAQVAALNAANQRYADAAKKATTYANRSYSDRSYTTGVSTTVASTTSSSGSRYTGGRVYVRGYYRADGTYVRPHTRSR